MWKATTRIEEKKMIEENIVRKVRLDGHTKRR